MLDVKVRWVKIAQQKWMDKGKKKNSLHNPILTCLLLDFFLDKYDSIGCALKLL